MHIHQLSQNKGLIRQPSLCAWLDLTRSGLDKLRKNDHTFPQPIKSNKTRQAAAYYVVAEVEAWLGSKIDARNKALAAVQEMTAPASASNSKNANGDAT